MNATIKCKIEANFNVEFYSNKKYLRISIINIYPNEILTLQSLHHLQEEIQEWDFLQENVTGIQIDSLNEEKTYNGKFTVLINYSETYDNWTGATEYDSDILLHCSKYEEKYTSNTLEDDNEYSKIFYVEGNKGGDHIYMKLLSSGKIHLSFAHCCVKHGDQFIDVTTLTACLAEHLHKYRTKHEG